MLRLCNLCFMLNLRSKGVFFFVFFYNRIYTLSHISLYCLEKYYLVHHLSGFCNFQFFNYISISIKQDLFYA